MLCFEFLFKRSSTTKIGVERVNQASKLTITEVNNIVDVMIPCVADLSKTFMHSI